MINRAIRLILYPPLNIFKVIEIPSIIANKGYTDMLKVIFGSYGFGVDAV